MPNHIHFRLHRIGDFHVITTPEITGFHGSKEALAEAERAAVEVLRFLAKERGEAQPTWSFDDVDVAA